ncbi:D-alanyl-D-alanine endopeptidase, partial [Pseudomonas graminis]
DSSGKYTHFAGTSRMRLWMETGRSGLVSEVALQYKKEKNQVMRQNGLQASE